jgi:ribosome-associated protein YbcJ (S4-like RNA binding protein)
LNETDGVKDDEKGQKEGRRCRKIQDKDGVAIARKRLDVVFAEV